MGDRWFDVICTDAKFYKHFIVGIGGRPDRKFLNEESYLDLLKQERPGLFIVKVTFQNSGNMSVEDLVLKDSSVSDTFKLDELVETTLMNVSPETKVHSRTGACTSKLKNDTSSVCSKTSMKSSMYDVLRNPTSQKEARIQQITIIDQLEQTNLYTNRNMALLQGVISLNKVDAAVFNLKKSQSRFEYHETHTLTHQTFSEDGIMLAEDHINRLILAAETQNIPHVVIARAIMVGLYCDKNVVSQLLVDSSHHRQKGQYMTKSNMHHFPPSTMEMESAEATEYALACIIYFLGKYKKCRAYDDIQSRLSKI